MLKKFKHVGWGDNFLYSSCHVLFNIYIYIFFFFFFWVGMVGVGVICPNGWKNCQPFVKCWCYWHQFSFILCSFNQQLCSLGATNATIGNCHNVFFVPSLFTVNFIRSVVCKQRLLPQYNRLEKGNLCFDGAIWEIYGFRNPTLWNLKISF